MQNRYMGDVGDFGKYGLLRTLSGQTGSGPSLSLGVVWYLVPDEGHNDDGKHVSYLSKPAYRTCDPALFDGLRAIMADGLRDVARIQESDLFPRTTVYYDRFLSYAGLPTIGESARNHRLAKRENWLQGALKETVESDLVFLDPDNGFEIKSVKKHADKSPKYVFWDEATRFVERDQTLVFYHHLNRSADAPTQIQRKMNEFEDKLPGKRVLPVLFRRGSLRAFFVLPAERHKELIDRRLTRMLQGPWSSHMEPFAAG